MCIVLVILSLIPILSGYAIYLVAAALVTDAPPLVQVTIGVISSVILFLGLRQLWVYGVNARQRATKGAEE